MGAGGSLSVASATLRGIEALPVDVEIAASAGIPGMSTSGCRTEASWRRVPG